MFKPMGLLSSMMNRSQSWRPPILLGALSAAGLVGMVLPTPSSAQARWPFGEFHAPPPIQGMDPVWLGAMALKGDGVGGRVAQAIDKLTLARSGPEEGDTREPIISAPR